jgi:hypothetical protein
MAFGWTTGALLTQTADTRIFSFLRQRFEAFQTLPKHTEISGLDLFEPPARIPSVPEHDWNCRGSVSQELRDWRLSREIADVVTVIRVLEFAGGRTGEPAPGSHWPRATGSLDPMLEAPCPRSMPWMRRAPISAAVKVSPGFPSFSNCTMAPPVTPAANYISGNADIRLRPCPLQSAIACDRQLHNRCQADDLPEATHPLLDSWSQLPHRIRPYPRRRSDGYTWLAPRCWCWASTSPHESSPASRSSLQASSRSFQSRA